MGLRPCRRAARCKGQAYPTASGLVPGGAGESMPSVATKGDRFTAPGRDGQFPAEERRAARSLLLYGHDKTS